MQQLQSQVELLSQEKRELEGSRTLLQQEFETLQTQQKQTLARLEEHTESARQLKESQQASESLTNEIARLQAELNATQKSSESSQRKLAQFESQAREAEDFFKRVQSKLTEKETLVLKLEETRKQGRLEIENLQNRILYLEKSNAELKTSQGEALAACQKQKTETKFLQQRITTESEERDDATNDLANALSNNQCLQIEVSEMEQTIHRLREEVQTLQQENHETKVSLDESIAHGEAMQSERDRARRSLEASQQIAKSEALTRASELRKLSEVESLVGESRNQLEEANLTIEALQSKLSKAGNENALLISTMEEYQRNEEQFRTERHRELQIISEANAIDEATHQRIERLEGQLIHARQSLADTERSANEFRRRLAVADEQNSKTKMALEIATSGATRLAQERDDAVSEVEECKKRLILSIDEKKQLDEQLKKTLQSASALDERQRDALADSANVRISLQQTKGELNRLYARHNESEQALSKTQQLMAEIERQLETVVKERDSLTEEVLDLKVKRTHRKPRHLEDSADTTARPIESGQIDTETNRNNTKASSLEKVPSAKSPSVKSKSKRKSEKKKTRLDKKKWDDLTRIEGIGPKMEEILREFGITTFRKLSTTSKKKLKQCLSDAGPSFSVDDPGPWKEQARLAADGKWDALQVMKDRLQRTGNGKAKRTSKKSLQENTTNTRNG